MKIEDIEIHTGAVDFQFEPLRRLEAKCEAPTMLSKAPTIEDVNQKLREMAVSVGANAVIEVAYASGPSMTAWRSVRAKGLAVRKLSDEMRCPVCAETIKRAALKCRFCGAEVLHSAVAEPVATSVTPTANSPAPPAQEPLRSTDNPTKWIVYVVITFVVLWLLSLMS